MHLSRNHRVWEDRLARASSGHAKPGKAPGRRRDRSHVHSERESLLFKILYRLIFYLIAIAPGVGVLPLTTGYALLATLWMTALLTQRGPDEFVLSLFGARDTDLIRLARSRMQKRVGIVAADLSIFLTIRAAAGHLPWWSLCVGIPLLFLAFRAGPGLLYSIVPHTALNKLPSWIFVLAMVLAPVLLNARLDPPIYEALGWLFGILTPAGWVLIFMTSAGESPGILWAIPPIVFLAAWWDRSLAPSQDREVLKVLDPVEEQPVPEIDCELEKSLCSTPDSTAEASLRDSIEDFRARSLLDYPDDSRRRPPDPKVTAIALSLLALAAFWARWAENVHGGFRYVPFILVLAGIWLLGFPILGSSAWFQTAFIAINRICPIFTLHPVSLRTLVAGQIRDDLSFCLRMTPFLFAITLLGCCVAFSLSLVQALVVGAVITIYGATRLPVRWALLSLGWNMAGRWTSWKLVRVTFLVVGVFLAFFEVLLAMITVGSFLSELPSSGLVVVGIAPTVCLVSLSLGFLWLSILNFEKGKTDILRCPHAGGSI